MIHFFVAMYSSTTSSSTSSGTVPVRRTTCEIPSAKTCRPARGASCRAVPESSIGQSCRRKLGQASHIAFHFADRDPVVDGLLPRPAFGVQTRIHNQPPCPPQLKLKRSQLAGKIVVIPAALDCQRFSIQAPTLAERELCLPRGFCRRGNGAIPCLPAEEHAENGVREPLRDKRATAYRAVKISGLPGER